MNIHVDDLHHASSTEFLRLLENVLRDKGNKAFFIMVMK